jgi:NOL1/NOP2/fmu family ribosome biogenesis protein
VLKAYSANKPETCAAMQADILRHAAVMVRPGGRLVYSTCTFNTVENEETVEKFIKTQKSVGVVFTLEQVKRIWPHTSGNGGTGVGEGHFVAVLTRGEEPIKKTTQNSCISGNSLIAASNILPPIFMEFCRKYLHKTFLLNGPLQGTNDTIFIFHPVMHKNSLYLQPSIAGLPVPFDLRGLRMARNGWHVGDISKERFIPSQALAMGLRKDDALFSVNFNEADAWRYVKGETLDAENCIKINSQNNFFAHSDADKPWILVCHETHPLGWARLVQNRLKNHLPNGWVR